MELCERKGVMCECLTDHSTCNSDNCHRNLPDIEFTSEEVKHSLEDAGIELVDGELNMEKPEFFGEVRVIDVLYKVSREDKERLVNLMSEAKQILNKYPYTYGSVKCARDWAKTAVFDANEWCNCLEISVD